MGLWIIEARDESGKLLLGDYPQPESVFGRGAIAGMTDWQMSRVILRRAPQQFDKLRGDNIQLWPSFIDPRWSARRKTW